MTKGFRMRLGKPNTQSWLLQCVVILLEIIWVVIVHMGEMTYERRMA
jgi:hypothetical protein